MGLCLGNSFFFGNSGKPADIVPKTPTGRQRQLKPNSTLMKTNLFIVTALLALASCSTPKYTYKFDYHDYNAGRKEKQAMKEVAANPGPIEIQPEMLVAEAPASSPSSSIESKGPTTQAKSIPLTLSKAERKEMVKNLKAAVKQIVKKKSGDVLRTDQASKAMDSDLKMSLIWLVVSILFGALIPLGELFWIASLAAFVVALIFFIKWLLRQ